MLIARDFMERMKRLGWYAVLAKTMLVRLEQNVSSCHLFCWRGCPTTKTAIRVCLGFVVLFWVFLGKNKKSPQAHVSTLTLKQYTLLGQISAHGQSWNGLWFGKHMGHLCEQPGLQ